MVLYLLQAKPNARNKNACYKIVKGRIYFTEIPRPGFWETFTWPLS